MKWKVYAASAIGKHHIEVGLPCQDAFAYEHGDDWFVGIVCDGAGSAAHSDIGASTAATEAVRFIKALLEQSQLVGHEQITLAVQSARKMLESLADEHHWVFRDLACTMVGAIVTSSGGLIFHVGDGLGVVDLPGNNTVVSPPENGEYANETWFVTADEWLDHLRVVEFSEAPLRIALMSDGAMPFVMNRGHSRLSEPFIVPVEKYLVSVSEELGSEGLAATLGDERTWAITGDDKTLLMAFPG